jgi:hypothetical protein
MVSSAIDTTEFTFPRFLRYCLIITQGKFSCATYSLEDYLFALGSRAIGGRDFENRNRIGVFLNGSVLVIIMNSQHTINFASACMCNWLD